MATWLGNVPHRLDTIKWVEKGSFCLKHLYQPSYFIRKQKQLTLSADLFSVSFFTFSDAVGLPLLLPEGKLDEALDSCLMGLVTDTFGCSTSWKQKEKLKANSSIELLPNLQLVRTGQANNMPYNTDHLHIPFLEKHFLKYFHITSTK